MKVKCFLGAWLIVLSCNLLVPSSAQAEARPLQWSTVELPGTSGNVVISPSEVTEIAIGSGIFYALDAANSRVYRSRNGGVTWEEITKHLTRFGALVPFTKIAIAPDSPSIVVVVTNNGKEVSISVDGGITWVNISVPPLNVNETIQAIAISEKYSADSGSFRDVAIGTAIWGDGLTSGQVWVLKLGIPVVSWQNSRFRVDPNRVGGEVSAIAFSPAYAGDQTIVVVASTNIDVAAAYQNKTFLCIGQPKAQLWNHISGYPVPIANEGDGAGLDPIASGLALPSTYTSALAPSRRVFTFFYRPSSVNNDVYRIDDTTVVDLDVAGSGSNVDISSISLSGSKLLAGSAVSDGLIPPHVPIYITSNAFGSPPGWQPATQPPSGPGNAKVAWGTRGTAYCGTGQSPTAQWDESAFSISTDGGDTWMQTSLIDTSLTLLDVAVASSPASLFITSTSPLNIESVWRSAGKPLGQYWGRVLVMNATSNKVIIRLSPNYQSDYTLYVAEVDGKLMWVTNDRGNSWRGRYALGQVVDIVVADKNVIYVALKDGTVAKSTTGAISWQTPTPTCLPEINMLSLFDRQTLLVGGRNGDVAYSVDGGISFIKLFQTVNGGNVQVVADANFIPNRIIYAGCGSSIYRCIADSSANWETMEALSPNQQISGMVIADGVLYVAWYNAVGPGSGAKRCLEPTIPLISLEWDSLRVGAEAARFDITPTSLRYSVVSAGIHLWAIDTAGSTLMVYFDCLAETSPVVSSPELVGCDPVSGRNQEIVLCWEQPCLADEYEIWVFKDLGGKPDVSGTPIIIVTGYVPTIVTNPSYIIAPGNPNLECGHTYWWKVRVRGAATGEVIWSPWSGFKSFSIRPGSQVTAPTYGIQSLSPVNGAIAVPIKGVSFSWSEHKGATEYQFQLAEDAAVSRLLADTMTATTAYGYDKDLSYSTNYYWRVRAIKPVESDWSSVFSFMTEKAPAPSPVEQPPPQAPGTPIPFHLSWLVVGIGTFLASALIVLVVRTRR